MVDVVCACVLIRLEAGKARETLERVRGVEGVKEVFPVFGRFDAVAFIEGKDYEEVTSITDRINSLEGVRNTETLVEA